jgi:ferric-dicitrate binding protein FerR (iron transport regulator)
MPGEQAEQAAEKWHLRASGVKTPDESNALTSWLKPRPTNLRTFSAACKACLVLKLPAKFKCKQAEVRSTGSRLLACPSDRRRYPCTAGVPAERS